MSPTVTPALEVAVHPRGPLTIARDYWQLIRPRIVGLVLFTLVITAIVSGGRGFSWIGLGHAVVGSTLVIVGAIAFNARIERNSDAKMLRTSRRPLPAGRLSSRQATWFGIVASAAGFAYLPALGNWWLVLLAVASWLIYVWVYTPLKVFTAWQTPIGALAGAMPVLLGSAAVGAPWNPTALALFGVVYFWQFPHAMAIAWLYRQDFAAANLRVATVVDPTGRSAAWMSLAGAVVLLPISLVPVVVGTAGWVYAAIALAVNVAYLVPSGQFFLRRDDPSARRLLRASFGYVPVIFLAILLSF